EVLHSRFLHADGSIPGGWSCDKQGDSGPTSKGHGSCRNQKCQTNANVGCEKYRFCKPALYKPLWEEQRSGVVVWHATCVITKSTSSDSQHNESLHRIKL